jgi:hypothetical protein
MSLSDAQRLGAALMERNAMRIPYATFSCTVSAPSLKEMGAEAWKECQKFFGDQSFEITDLDTEAVQLVTLQAIGYTARVRARAV